jgi:hypothetical protein
MYTDVTLDPTCVLLPPCIHDPVAPSLVRKITTCLSTRFDISAADIRQQLDKATIKQYGTVRWVEGGDVINAASLVPTRDDHRDASFVRVNSH